jgi:hypothetical protein
VTFMIVFATRYTSVKSPGTRVVVMSPMATRTAAAPGLARGRSAMYGDSSSNPARQPGHHPSGKSRTRSSDTSARRAILRPARIIEARALRGRGAGYLTSLPRVIGRLQPAHSGFQLQGADRLTGSGFQDSGTLPEISSCIRIEVCCMSSRLFNTWLAVSMSF